MSVTDLKLTAEHFRALAMAAVDEAVKDELLYLASQYEAVSAAEEPSASIPPLVKLD